MNKERLIWYILFSIVLIFLIFNWFALNRKTNEYENLQELFKTDLKELEFTRMYLIENYCQEKNFTTGFKPVGKVVDNLTVICMDCVGSECGRIETFILK